MQNKNNVLKYPIASAGRRIFAKFIDIAIISLIVLSLGFSIFCTDPNFEWHGQLNVSNWRYGVFVALMLLVFFGLMLLLPKFWNKTIGMKILKLKYFKKFECNFFFALFKHELFIWEIIVLIAFVMGCTLSGLSSHQIDSLIKGSNGMFNINIPDDVDIPCYYTGAWFSCMYCISFIFLIVIIVGVCIKNKKPAFHDKYSNIYVIYTQPLNQSQSTKHLNNKHDERNVPGQISNESLEEIGNI